MKVSYTIYPERLNALSGKYDSISLIPIQEISARFFLEFIKNNSDNDIFFNSISDTGLQVIQMLPALEYLKKSEKIIYIENQELFLSLDYQRVFDFIYGLAIGERMLLQIRTTEYMKMARANGVSPGRPSISPLVKVKIKHLHTIEKRSIREIALICGVSVGTAYKYAKKDTPSTSSLIC
ncbi:hypothetical protein I6N95_24905 [Vagococcus sp. BWB3-3]|uniref:Recombinase family protein n=1 Tax=Vagococcus allomyrinae TaxID=2794353 RepID=A0A940PGM2_9ENTE|nr:hypothetical protein [Vagococcus allomyrinae]MBP1044252.1 hypothetical protein [Vagococcus allomyrinae]